MLILAWGRFVVLGLWSLVAGYAVLAHVQPLGCPKVSWLLPKPYWARLTLLGRSEGRRGVLTSPGIKSSQPPPSNSIPTTNPRLINIATPQTTQDVVQHVSQLLNTGPAIDTLAVKRIKTLEQAAKQAIAQKVLLTAENTRLYEQNQERT